MAFLAFSATNFLNRYTVQLLILDILVEFGVNAVKLIAGAVLFIIKIHFCFAVTVDTPAHAEF